jgi:subtilisin-like proprotein convertase family protein
MKKEILLAILTASALLPAQASLYSVGNVNGSGTSLNQTIYDASPSGITSTLLVGGADTSLTGVNVTLNTSGGYNGDLYAYLLAPNGTLVVLLNRVGTSATSTGNLIQDAFGYSTAGFNNISFSDTGTGGNIHNVANPVSSISYTPDGGSLASFNGVDPNGAWTLFFADESAGNTSTLNGWSLNITAVPEPVNAAMAIFGVGFIGAGVVRGYRGSRKATIPLPPLGV